MISKKIQIYAAGPLFDLGHLTSNLFLKEAIETNSNFKVLLPQDIEFPDLRASSIKHEDLLAVFKADAGIVNLDGVEADSGTLVEFMVMKALNLPTVLYRTDFRKAGDQLNDNPEPWNLMLSGWPNSRSVVLNAMSLYKDASNQFARLEDVPQRMHSALAQRITKELESLFSFDRAFFIDEQRLKFAIESTGKEFISFLNVKFGSLEEFITSRLRRG